MFTIGSSLALYLTTVVSKSMSLSSRISPSPSAYGLTLRSTQRSPSQLGQPSFATQSYPQLLQQHEQPKPVYMCMVPEPSMARSAFPRYCHALSATATAAGELFIFGGYVHGGSPSNDLCVFTTRSFSSTFWHTTGNVPSPPVGHSAVLIGDLLLI